MEVKAIETENLCKYYGKSIGIENVNLSVGQGEIFGFIGPNGAGKSTTIRTLLNLLFPTSGTAKIFGIDVISNSKKIMEKTGYLPAEVNYYYKMSVNDLLQYSSRFYDNIAPGRIEYLCEALDLKPELKIRDLSFGNKKKVSIVQALLHKPELLILDEPTAGLDPLIQAAVFDLLKEENKRGATIFFSSHILSDIQKICSRVAIIQKGKIIKVESIESLQEKMLKKVFLEFNGNPAVIEFAKIGAENIKSNHTNISFLFKGNMNDLIRSLSNISIVNLTIEEPTLEEIFMHYYKKGDNNVQ